ncbi:hypothetical protein MMC08_002354 [Hypocenomyce scalaris]|nr:hypothetical protein [Hypocenomyce scalaris]
MPRRGGHPSGDGSRPPRPPPSREVIVSKAMSYVLRHAAEREGLRLDENGYANVADLLAWQKFKSLKVTFPEIQQVVAENDKQRFSLLPSPSKENPTSPADYLIRANQGHSLPVSSANLLSPILPTDPDFPSEVVHGTFPSLWPQILESGGLKRMKRTHIHFATGLPDAPPMLSNSKSNGVEARDSESGKDGERAVISGMRKDASVLVWVDVKKAMEEGELNWWRSSNGVVLTEGDAKGMVEVKFVKRVVKRGTGKVIWMPEGAGKDDGKGVGGREGAMKKEKENG